MQINFQQNLQTFHKCEGLPKKGKENQCFYHAEKDNFFERGKDKKIAASIYKKEKAGGEIKDPSGKTVIVNFS